MARALTAGEIAMASALFGDAIDYARVRIHNRRYLPYLQPKNCAMSPNGSLYFHRSRCRDDFSLAPDHERRWFMHEMVHVWQHQLGYPVRLRGAVRLGLDYRYRLHPDATLADFNMEAQGDLLADYYMLSAHDPARALYEQVLRSFLHDPGNRSNLPSLW